jgi:hypothetical protein
MPQMRLLCGREAGALHTARRGQLARGHDLESAGEGRSMNRKRRNDEPVVRSSSNRQHRCICCDGEIDIAPDQDASPGLSLRLGLVSDEYALICDGCAARLAAERLRERSSKKHGKVAP